MGCRGLRKDVEAGLALAKGRQRRSDVPRNGKPRTRGWKGGGALLKKQWHRGDEHCSRAVAHGEELLQSSGTGFRSQGAGWVVRD